MPGALDGLRVLDVSRYVAGPLCAMLLADHGAEVIKVEKCETGEDARGFIPSVNGESLFVMVFNRNKRSLTLNFRDPRGQELLRALAAEADIIVENFRPGVMEAMGCGWDVLSGANERLIMARISGYGQDGPYANRPTFDAIAQADSGLMEMTGEQDGRPLLMGTAVIDHMTGMHAVIGVLAAVEARHKTGRGQVVDVSLFDSALSMMMTAIPAHGLLGEPTPRSGNRDRYGSPANSFPTSDNAYVHIVAGGDARFLRFLRATGMEALLDDPRYNSSTARLENAEALEAVVADWTRRHTVDEIEKIFVEASVPCSRVRDIGGLFEHPQVKHREQIIDVEHPVAGAVPMQGFVAKLSHTKAALRHGIPTAGQHNNEILSDWLGYDDKKVRSLADQGVI